MLCVNCDRVLGNDHKLVLGVCVCGTCATLAKLTLERFDTQLKQLQVLMRESVRVALVQKQLGKDSEPTKSEMLLTINQILQGKDHAVR